MKKFTDILTESKKTYKFIVRVADELPEGCMEKMKEALGKFDLVNLSSAKRTPIQERPLDFPKLQNTEVHTFEAEVNYPTTSQVLHNYLVGTCDIRAGHMIVRAEGEPLEQIQEPVEEGPYEAKLNTEDMGGESAQDSVGANRVMDLLKELETARKEREIDPMEGAPTGESKDISDVENTKAVVGS